MRPLLPFTLLLAMGVAPALAQSGMTQVMDGARAPSPIPLGAPSREEIARRLLEEARSSGSNANHLRYLDQGAAADTQAAAIPDRLVRQAPLTGGSPFPRRGELPSQIGGLDFLSPTIEAACLVVYRGGAEGELHAEWYGKRPLINDQWWSATKHLQALHVASALGERAPQADLGQLSLRRRGTRNAGYRVPTLLRQIVSYEAGVPRSNGGAETFGRFFTRRERQDWNVAHTGHPHDFRGAYGAAPLAAPPELVDAQGQVLLTGPTDQGPGGPNLISAYDMARLTAMAAWHPLLEPEARLASVSAASLATILEAMGWDSARYVDVGLRQLGARVERLAVASKLGFGVRSATGLPEATWAAAVRFDSPQGPQQFVLALRGVHRDAVRLDVTMAAEVSEILRRLLDGRL